jgi:hypothetical protein
VIHRSRPQLGEGQEVSELDRIRPERWLPAWSKDLQYVLALLWPVVELQSAQNELLDRVLTSPLVSVAELQRRNVLPVPETARRSAPPPIQTELIPGTEGIEPHAVRPLTAERSSPAGVRTRPRRSRNSGDTQSSRRNVKIRRAL